MLYFAYASNLDPEAMRARCPGHRVVGLASLADHRLSFPLYSADWHGGVASPTLAHGEKVWGIVFDLTDEDLTALDAYEGWRAPGDQHNLYERETVLVELVRPDDGSVPRRLRALTYFARSSNPSPPSRVYLDTVVRGARHHRLPDDYVEMLETTEVRDEAEASGG